MKTIHINFIFPLLLLTITITVLSSFTKFPFQKDTTFIVKGEILNVPDDSKIELFDIGDGTSTTITSTVVKNNSFELKGNSSKTTLASLVIEEEEEPIYLVLSAGETIIKGGIKNVGQITFTGNDDIKEFSSVYKKINESAELLYNLDLKSKTLTSVNEVNENDKMILSAFKSFASDMISFIKDHPDSYSSNYFLVLGNKLLAEKNSAETAYSYLSETNKRNHYVERVMATIKDEAPEGIGKIAKNFTLKTPIGTSVSLSDFKGKYVLVDFWASWCGPCRAENPNVARAYRLFKDNHFTILGISLDEEKSNWLAAIKNDKLTWTHISDLKGCENSVAIQYKIESIPQNMLIGPKGNIIAKNLRGYSLLKFLSENLEK